MSYSVPTSSFRRQEQLTAETGLDALFAGARTYNFSKGARLYLQGDDFRGVFRVSSGIVGLRHLDEHGSSMLTTLRWPGTICGDETLLNERPYETSAEILVSGQVAWISAATARRRLSSDHSITLALLTSMSLRIEAVTEALMSYMNQPAHVRLAKTLLLLAEHSSQPLLGAACSFTLPITHQELAETIGVRAETLSRAIGYLRTRRLLKVNGDRVTLVNVPRLRRTADENLELTH